MELRYIGTLVDNGSIDLDILKDSFDGFSKIVKVISTVYSPKNPIIIKVNYFDKGSFRAILKFVENHPVLFNNLGIIIFPYYRNINNHDCGE